MGEAYGNPQSRKVFDRFYDELTQKRGLSKKPCLLGRSRGGLWVSSWACDHPERFAGIAGIYPVYDLRSYPGLDKAAPAYGLSKSELEKRLDEFNPIARVGVLAKAKLPVYIIHGDEDKVVPLEVNSPRWPLLIALQVLNRPSPLTSSKAKAITSGKASFAAKSWWILW